MEKEKLGYVSPAVEVVVLNSQDIVTLSLNEGDGPVYDYEKERTWS